MKNSRGIKLGALFLISTLLLVGCGGKDKGTTKINRNRDARGTSEGIGPRDGAPQALGEDGRLTYQPASGKSWGTITGSPQNLFQQAMDLLVSASLYPADDFGTVSGQPGQDTGVRFWGDVKFQNGRLSNSGMNSQGLQVDLSRAELRIVIWDSFADQVGSEYPIHFDRAVDGYVNGNSARIRWADEYGWVELNGTINGEYFSGSLSFETIVFGMGKPLVLG